jgi:hypothetical protein
MKQEALIKLINNIIDTRIKTDEGEPLPNGYNALSVIRGGLFHWIAVPFNGKLVFCELRCLNATQLEACGDISNITQLNTEDKTISKEQVIRIRNYQEMLCRAVLNRPTFDEITALIGKNDFVIANKQKELNDIRNEIETSALTSAQKAELEVRCSAIELFLGYILPSDTMNFLTQWAMGNDISNIKEITREKFIEAATLAKIAGDNPSDHILGTYTDYNKNEIDVMAWSCYNEEQSMKERSKGHKYRWIGGRHNG